MPFLGGLSLYCDHLLFQWVLPSHCFLALTCASLCVTILWCNHLSIYFSYDCTIPNATKSRGYRYYHSRAELIRVALRPWILPTWSTVSSTSSSFCIVFPRILSRNRKPQSCDGHCFCLWYHLETFHCFSLKQLEPFFGILYRCSSAAEEKGNVINLDRKIYTIIPMKRKFQFSLLPSRI